MVPSGVSSPGEGSSSRPEESIFGAPHPTTPGYAETPCLWQRGQRLFYGLLGERRRRWRQPGRVICERSKAEGREDWLG